MITREERFKQLKRERNKWWKETVPKDVFNGRHSKPEKKNAVPAFHLGRNGKIEKVRVWVDSNNYKSVSGSRPYNNYASGRTWPTEEGVLFDKVDRAQKLADRCAKTHEKAKKELSKALNELDDHLAEEKVSERQ